MPKDNLRAIYDALHAHFGRRHWWPADSPFEIMVGAILTQNTAWNNVERAIGNLKKAKVLHPKTLFKMSSKKLAALIRPAGYFNIKADRLKQFMAFLFREYGGSIPRMFLENGDTLRKKLLAVKGIGPETADSILLYAGGKRFFVIDAYTKRIFARHKLHRLDGSYDEWQNIFKDSLSKSVGLYNDFHAQIVAVGKDYCRTSPRCDICPLKSFL